MYIHLHSKYNPTQEAAQFIDTVYSDESTNYILFGLGLGYHLNDLHKRVSTQDRIIIFEKNPTLVRLALSQNNFSEVLSNPKVSIYIDTDPGNIEQILYENRTSKIIKQHNCPFEAACDEIESSCGLGIEINWSPN